LEVIHPEVTLESQRSVTEGVFRGHQGIREFMADTAQTFDLFRPEYADVRDLGDRVLAIGSIRVRGKESGVETDVPTAAIAEFREGLLWNFKDYVEERLALGAVGLEE
jgi:ketosteroid isomerase-like protein